MPEIQYINRNLYLYNQVNFESAYEIVSAINEINDYDTQMESQDQMSVFNAMEKGIISQDTEIQAYKRDPIFLEINCFGGETPAGFSIIHAIKNSTTPIIGFVTGECMSMAVPILSSCHFRIASELSNFMIHDTYGGTEGKYHDLRNSLSYIEKVRDNYKKVITETSNIDANTIDTIFDANADHHFSAQEAMELGLIDSLSEEGVEIDVLMHKLYGDEIKDSELNKEKDSFEVEDDSGMKVALHDNDTTKESGFGAKLGAKFMRVLKTFQA